MPNERIEQIRTKAIKNQMGMYELKSMNRVSGFNLGAHKGLLNGHEAQSFPLVALMEMYSHIDHEA